MDTVLHSQAGLESVSVGDRHKTVIWLFVYKLYNELKCLIEVAGINK